MASGILHIHILDAGETMNEMLYIDLVEDCFEDWAGDCDLLVSDFEACLRTDASLHALSQAGLEFVPDHPRCSQDFNAMENCWEVLKERLDETMPSHMEDREAFVARLHQAVSWANRYRKTQLWYLSTNQKERARECLATTPPGGRTSF